jgi:NADH:ubiquinone oxidoreductase subunit 5 (subunit L)/multisubunit Na+/H+ antiporter MnhA subunit/multisubunit Na+/H+ antiporter MnhB subunit
MVTDGLLVMMAAVFGPCLFGMVSILVPDRMRNTRTIVALCGPLISFALLGSYLMDHGAGGAGTAIGFAFVPSVHLDMTFNPDGLGLFFGLLVSGIGSLIVLYTRGYFGGDEKSLKRFYPPLGLFTTAMMGLVLADNMLALVLFWELTSVSSFLLIGWNRESKEATRLAVQALVTTGLGGIALLGGVLLLGASTGMWSLMELNASFSVTGALAGGWVGWAFALIFLGGATKSAQWPFHYWLPGAMAAPTPVSAFLHSATMVKAGIYLFGRLYPSLHAFAWWAPTLVVIGGITMLLGGYLALRSSELKKIFAYTTVSQLGLFTCVYGLGAWDHDGAANLIWPVTQILNHALYKAPLFIIAGAIMILAGRKYLPELKGLLKTHRTLAVVCLLALYAMAGGPFTLSFVAKEAFFYQLYHAAEHDAWVWIIAAMAVLMAVFNVAIFMRFLTTFAAEPDADAVQGKAPERGFWGACLWWPAAFLLIFQFTGGLFTAWFGSVVHAVETHPLYFEHLPSVWHAVSHPGVPLAMSGVAIVLGVLLGLSPMLRGVQRDPHDSLFGASLAGLQQAGWWAFSTLQAGNFRTYVYVTLTALFVGISSSLLWEPEFAQWPEVLSPMDAPMGLAWAALIVTVLICLTSLAIPVLRSRIVRVLVLGVCGFAVTSMYLLYQAPDLALTQLMFEIISVVLFLLVLRMLPEEPKARPKGGRLGRALFGTLMGVGLGWMVLQVGSFVDSTPGNGLLGEWFTQNAHDGSALTDGRGGGGDNIVNVILVDFRGYDTLGEITVLAIAAIGVFVLIGRSKRRGDSTVAVDVDHHGVDHGAQPVVTSSLFKTGMKLILPLSLMFALYMFFKGHNEPGGGFIAGLVAAVSLAVYRMAEGPDALKKLLPMKPGPLAAWGLLIALTTAFVPILLGYPLMRSHIAVVPLPGDSVYHLASVMFFDLGVLIVVIAVSVGVINRLTEELE